MMDMFSSVLKERREEVTGLAQWGAVAMGFVLFMGIEILGKMDNGNVMKTDMVFLFRWSSVSLWR